MTHRYYTLWAPIYDWIAGPYFERFRRRAVAELRLEPGQRLFIPGVGTGLDFAYLPPGIEAAGIDLNEAMLSRGRRRAQDLGLKARLELGDAENVAFPDESFDAAYLPDIVCVAENGGRVLSEALRVVKSGGRVVVMDKFLPEGARPGVIRSLLDRVAGPLVTRVNRRWSEVAGGASGFTLVSESAGPLGGFFRMYVLHKG